MKNIYLPVNNVNDYACYFVYDKDTIRAYVQKPQLDSSSQYVDFYINSHYLQKTGTQSFGQWNSSLPTCINKSIITNDVYYRTDILSCILLFISMSYLIFYLPLKLTCGRMFRRFLS